MPLPATDHRTAVDFHYLHATTVSVLSAAHRHHAWHRLLIHLHRAHQPVQGPCSSWAVKPPAGPTTWAATAAAIWQAGKPELFDAAYADVTVPGDSLNEAWADKLAGELAANALANGVDLPQAAVVAAVAWTTDNVEARRTQQFWLGLASGIARSSGQIPISVLGRLCQRADVNYPAEVTAPLLTAYISRLLGEISKNAAPDPSTIRWITKRLHGDPHLAEAAGVRDYLQEAFSSELPADQALLLLRIADAAGIEDPGQLGEAVLGPTLLGGGSPAFKVAEFLSSTSNLGLQARVLDFLEDAARHSGGRAAVELVNGVSGQWLLRVDLDDFPLLNAAVQLATERDPGRVAVFRRAVALLSAWRPDDLRYAYGLAWPDRPPSLSEACELLSGESSLPILEIPGTAEAFIDLIRSAPVIRAETIWLADLLRTRTPPPDPHDCALLNLVATTGLLRQAANQPGDAGLSQEVPRTMLAMLAAWPHPGPARDAATDALLTLLVAPSRLKDAGIDVQAELHILVTSGDKDLIAAFAERAEQDLADELIRSPRLHASCFILWRLEYGQPGDQAWPAAKDNLMTGLLAPTAREIDVGSKNILLI